MSNQDDFSKECLQDVHDGIDSIVGAVVLQSDDPALLTNIKAKCAKLRKSVEKMQQVHERKLVDSHKSDAKKRLLSNTAFSSKYSSQSTSHATELDNLKVANANLVAELEGVKSQNLTLLENELNSSFAADVVVDLLAVPTPNSLTETTVNIDSE